MKELYKKYYEITQSFNLFFLSYDYYNKPSQQIFNDWARATGIKAPPELIADVYDFITSFKRVHISSVITAAEADGNLFPDIFTDEYDLRTI